MCTALQSLTDIKSKHIYVFPKESPSEIIYCDRHLVQNMIFHTKLLCSNAF